MKGVLISGAVALIAALLGTPMFIRFLVKRGYGHHPGYNARAEFRHDRGWHRGWRGHGRDKVVIVKKHRYY